uniref:cDNA FLJ51254, highly similar to Dystroglycan n=1 Tax=Homo sapiens TaxID=9606 RepID=B4DN78_HUMAN|nr:unnamed protein product [Homo sapiens]
MTPKQRIDLLHRMRSFSEVELHNMKLVPVVNNRLFDMSAFMAGPGNAKKVVENGALLSWKLGCSLNQNSVPDIHGVEAPAREGAMSAQLGYPVVGWHIANKKPALSGPPKPQSSWRDFGDFFIFIFCLTAFGLFIENSSLHF